MRSSPDLLAELTFDVWLPGKFGPQLGAIDSDGRTWERTVASLLYRPGFTRRQGPGNHTLFGMLSASGVEHEIDGAAHGWRDAVIVECKATEGGVSKADAALFRVNGGNVSTTRLAINSANCVIACWPSGVFSRVRSARLLNGFHGMGAF